MSKYPRVPETEMERLRRQQAERVMPLVGPLLDAWEGLPGDLQSELREEPIGKYLDEVNAAMEED